jgi:hypothetical protein
VDSQRKISGKGLAALYYWVLDRLRRRRKPQEPEDPYAYVTAPKKPRPSSGTTAATLELPDD